MRTIRIAIVAAAIGASAGAGVVFSLVDRPDADESVAARTLVGPTVTALPTLPLASPIITHSADATAAESGAAATTEHPVSAAALAEAPLIPADDPTVAKAAAPQSKTIHKQRDLNWWRNASRDTQGRGSLFLVPSSHPRTTVGANWPRDPRDAD